MSETVRQMVVRMSMDAGGFKKTASDIRGQINNLDKELKGMGSSVDPKLLTEKLSLQQAAITNLAAQVKQAETNFRNAKTEADKLAQAKRLSNLTTDLELAKKAAADTEKALARIDAMKWQNFGKTLTTLGGNLRRFGRQFSLFIGGPLAVLGGKAYKDALNYEQVMADIGIATETSGEELEALNNTVLKMTETIPMSYAELGALYRTLARAGVPAGELERVTRVIAGLGETTDVSAEESAAAMIKFMNVFNIPLSNIENFASSLVALGNAGVSTGSEIFEMAQRMAASGNLAGLSAVDVLSLASAFSSMGINAEAGGTSAGKLIKAFQLAAETGKGLEDVVKDNGEVVMGFSTALGITGEEFQAAWNKDQVGLILRFFDALSAGAEKGDASVLAMLDAMDLTEVRLSNLIGVAASNPNFFRDMLGIGEKAWKDNTALADGVEIAYGTAQAKQDIALNKMENASADVGENIVDILQPVITTVSNLVGEFGKLDEATQTRWVKVGAALVAIGPVSDAIGTAASGVGRIIGFVGKVKAGEVTLFTRLVDALKGPAGGWFLAAAGIGAVVAAINNIKTPTEQIIEGLQNIKVELDEKTYSQTTAALKELQGQSDALSGKQGEYNKNISSAVKAGYGTAEMYGTALGYEARFTQSEMASIAGKYAEEIDKLNGMIGAETDDVQRKSLAAQRDALQDQWNAETEAAKANYMDQVSALVNGMMSKHPEAKAALEKAAKDYDLLSALLEATKFVKTSEDDKAISEMWASIFTPEVMEEYLPDFSSAKPAVTAKALKEKLEESLASSLKTVGGEDSFAYTLLQTIVGDPLASGYYDPTLTKGVLDGLVELLDFKSATDKLKEKYYEGLAPGLADAFEGAKTPSLEKLGELGDVLTGEASRQGAAAAAAYSAAFNANLNLNTPPGRTGSVSGLIREINQQNLRTLRGYGIG